MILGKPFGKEKRLLREPFGKEHRLLTEPFGKELTREKPQQLRGITLSTQGQPSPDKSWGSV